MDKLLPDTDNIEALLGDSVPTLDVRTGSGDFYLPAAHIQLLEQIEHLSRYSHFIQIITGVTGIGKTTLLQQFYPSADDNSVHACCIQALPEMNTAALLAELSQQLNLNIDQANSTGGFLQAVIEHTELLKQLGRQLLIVIDDAENLSLEALELLFNQLSTLADDELRPHIVLFAAPQIKRTTEAPSLSNVVETSCHFIEIPTFDKDALNSLLQQCFSAAAARLDESQKQRIYSESLGLPGRVARVLDAVISDRQESKVQPTQSTSGSSKFLYPGLAVSLILILGVTAWLLVPMIYPEQPASLASAQQPSATPLATTDSNRVRLELEVTPKTMPSAPLDSSLEPSQSSSFEQRLAEVRTALEAAQKTATKPTPELTAERSQATDKTPVAAKPMKTATESTQLLELAAIKEPASPLKARLTAPTTSSQQPPTLILKLPPSADLEALPEQTDAQPDSQTTSLSDTQANTGSAENLTATPQAHFYGDGKTLLSWSPQGYTLQMLGARKQQSVLEFIASMPEPEKLLHFSTSYKEKPWYVVVYGNFSNRDTAMTAMGELPPQLRARRPWARSIKGVQDDIRRKVP